MSAKIKNIILRVQELVTKVIHWAVGQAKAFAKKVGKQELTGEPNKEIQGSEEITDVEVGKEIRFDPNGEGHRLWIDVQGTSVTVMVASKSGPLKAKIEEWKRRLLDGQLLGEKRSKAESLLPIADNLLDIIEKKGQMERHPAD